MDKSVDSAIEALAHENVFDPARAVEFWQRAGSPDFSKMVVYQTGLKVDWISQIAHEENVLERDDFFKVANGHGLESRNTVICTGVDPQKLEATLLRGGVDEQSVEQMLEWVRIIQNNAILRIKDLVHAHESRPTPGRVPESASQTLH